MRKVGGKRAQQEMVGFVLIVVVVVIALMIFLVISIRKPVQNTQSEALENILSSVMTYTTDCLIDDTPQSVNDLIQGCYNNKKCDGSNGMACDYLNKSLSAVLTDIYKTESKYQGYEFSVNVADNSTGKSDILFEKKEGACLSSSKLGSQFLSTQNRLVKINVLMRLCD